MIESQIKDLRDLNYFKTAPILSSQQRNNLMNQLIECMKDSDWFTIGIMATSSELAISTIRTIESFFTWDSMNILKTPKEDGPVFLKANQKNGDIYIRIEYGLGQGILLTCQHNDSGKDSLTLGPFPMNFFSLENKS